MNSTKVYGALALGAILAMSVPCVRAQEGPWRPSALPAPSGPAASIGRPQMVAESGYEPALPPMPVTDANVTPAVHADPIANTWSQNVIQQTQAAEPPTVPPPGVPPSVPALDPYADTSAPIGGNRGGFWDHLGGSWTGKPCKFQSDHAFDVMISPVGNPFYFEDPRSLTEVRPVFIFQGAPSSNPVFNGGHSEFFGLQARVALTDQWSIVMNKLGFVSLHPNDPMDDIKSQTGFAEVDIGPKWTFLRNENTGTVVAAGLTFQIPTGSQAEQNTGSLGLDPYITFAQNFGRNWLPQGFGSFDVMGEAGYDFSVDDKRTEYFHSSLHLDYDVANLHRFYPLLEVNWFHTTRRGDASDLTFEGSDLVNFGSRDITNRDLVTMDFGARYKCREWLQFGAAVEVPLTDRKDLTDYRLLFDVIIRY